MFLQHTRSSRTSVSPLLRAFVHNPLHAITTHPSRSATMSSIQPSSSEPAFSRREEASQQAKKKLRYADVGINLTDPTFRGIYHGKQAHEDDLQAVIQRAQDAGCEKMMVTGSDLEQSQNAINLAKEYPNLCYATIGIHPCSSTQFTTHPSGPSSLLSSLTSLALSASNTNTNNTQIVAFGEIGLDYDRLSLCPKETQLKYFAAQLDIAVRANLPLFLHSRAASEDFERLLSERWGDLRGKGGVVHSFTGTAEEMHRLVRMGLCVGVNGCSLKSEGNLEVVRQIPLDRLMLETDGPWCEIRPSHASSEYLADAPPLPKAVKKEKWAKDTMVKGRNEPCTIGRVAHVVAKVKGISVEVVSEAAWNNSVRLFGLGERPTE